MKTFWNQVQIYHQGFLPLLIINLKKENTNFYLQIKGQATCFYLSHFKQSQYGVSNEQSLQQIVLYIYSWVSSFSSLLYHQATSFSWKPCAYWRISTLAFMMSSLLVVRVVLHKILLHQFLVWFKSLMQILVIEWKISPLLCITKSTFEVWFMNFLQLHFVPP